LDSLLLLAAHQHGLFTARQAQELGVSLKALRQAVDRGWLRRVRRGVYAFVGRRPSQWEPVVAASLAAGSAAVISHRSAAAIHGFWAGETEPELTVVGGAGRTLEGVRIHRSIGLLPTDVLERSDLRITSPIRTLLDVAPGTSDYHLSRIIDEGAIARLWTPEAILTRLDAASSERRSGAPRFRRLLAVRLGESNPDSQLEQRVIRVFKLWLPPFSVHHRLELGGRTVELDVAWPEHSFGAEIDGRLVRMASRSKFDSDRLRSNLLELHGWRVVHLTATMDDETLLSQVVPFFPQGVIDGRVRAKLAHTPVVGASTD
jgi:hypothetical protein